MTGDEAPRPTIPRWTGLAVFFFVLVLVAVVIASLRIPHALRPTILTPHTTVITITTTRSP